MHEGGMVSTRYVVVHGEQQLRKSVNRPVCDPLVGHWRCKNRHSGARPNIFHASKLRAFVSLKKTVRCKNCKTGFHNFGI